MLNTPLVLLYHAICRPATKPDPEERAAIVDPDSFAWQMAELAGRGYRTLELDEYARCLAARLFPPRSLLLTFDDAYAHIAEVVTPVIRAHGFTAVVFAPWQHLGARNTWDTMHPNLARLEIATPELLKQMAAGPWEVASHGFQHIDLRTLERRERCAGLIAARERFSGLLQCPVVDLAYPFGESDELVREDARAAGYRMAFTATPARIRDGFELPRQAIKGGDTHLTFRLKTSPACEWLYQRAPNAARLLARTTLQAASRA